MQNNNFSQAENGMGKEVDAQISAPASKQAVASAQVACANRGTDDRTTRTMVETNSANAEVTPNSIGAHTNNATGDGAEQINSEAAPDDTSITVSSPQPKKGGNQSATAKKALLEKVRKLLEQGHPPDAIAILCKVQPSRVHKYIAELVSLGQLPNCVPSYSLLSGGMQFQNIASLNITKNHYVCVTPTADGGVLLKTFNIDEVHCQ